MEVMKFQKGQVIAKRDDEVKGLYLIQEGSVIQKLDFSEITLRKNAIIGIMANGQFINDFIAAEDATIILFPCKNVEELKVLIEQNQRFCSVFLYALIAQRHQIFGLYLDMQNRIRQYYAFVQTVYKDYHTICEKYQLDEHAIEQMDAFPFLKPQYKVEDWEISRSVSLVSKYQKMYIQLMEQDRDLCVGAIMQASLQTLRALQAIREMVSYLSEYKSLLLSESENDIFWLFFDLAVRAGKRQMDLEPIKKELTFIADFIRKVKIYDAALAEERIRQYMEYDFNSAAAARFENMDIVSMDCLGHILEYAEFKKEEIEAIRQQVEAYRKLPDKASTDSAVYKIRKQLSPMFYDVYTKAFMQAVKDENTITPVIEMFLNFGFMDVKLAGEENAKALFDLTGRMKQFHSKRVYTIYEWLKSIYHGRKEPSKNEFDLDYPANLIEMRKNGDITEEQAKALLHNQEEKVKFEIKNLFTSANRITCGKITTFCPILSEDDLINTLDKMAVTAEKLEQALDRVREVDFSLMYREVNFPAPGLDIMNHETIMLEVFPDMILMPNVGTRAMMWQETADKRRDSPARFLFSIFTVADLDELMLETAGRYRWEMCRKIQGVRWNDIREKSLTSEYCDYIQFYRKNRDLSADAKDKLKLAIARAKNNYREVFVKDYQNWIKFESKGSVRLNKVSRDILIQYCPFAKDIRAALKSNPNYQLSIPKFETDNAKKVQRLNALYEKYRNAGGKITPVLEKHLMYYQL